jgi:uncharacterized membrane protein YraQ (UPF0718 family)/copper chaperone CopZ
MTILLEFFKELWLVLCMMAPWILFGFFVAGLLSLLISPEYVEKHLGKKGIVSVIKASILGVPLPLCSCGVIPVASSIKRNGASKGAVSAFLISTPQTGVDSMLVTYSMLGIVFAVFKPVAAFFSGLVGGAMIDVFADNSPEEAGENQVADIEEEKPCEDSCCKAEKESKTARKTPVEALKYGFITLLGDIAVPLLAGIVIAAVISMAVPENFIDKVTGNSPWTMLAMLVMGIPLYVCSTASVPIAAALIMKGISPGAALVFLMTGPATNAATIAMIWKSLGRKSLIIYLVSIAGTALLFGVVMNLTYDSVPAGLQPIPKGKMLPSVIQQLSAVVLLGLMCYHFLANICHRFFRPAVTAGLIEINFRIEGMSCKNCQKSVETAILALPKVKRVDIDLKSGQATAFSEEHLDPEMLQQTIEKIGYSIVQNQ